MSGRSSYMMTNQNFGTTFANRPKPPQAGNGFLAGNFYGNLVDQAMGGPAKKLTYHQG